MEKENCDNKLYTAEEFISLQEKEILYYSKVEAKQELKECSYMKGYHTQELWSCMTCFKEKSSLAGICIGCAHNCHQDHDIVHLYFKRNFKCDCGNSKYGKKF
jgi:E3 ubiquitin-protein ligase UBR7